MLVVGGLCNGKFDGFLLRQIRLLLSEKYFSLGGFLIRLMVGIEGVLFHVSEHLAISLSCQFVYELK